MKKFSFFPSASESRVTALLFIIMGLILCFFAKGIITSAVRFIAIIVLIYGIWKCWQYFQPRRIQNSGSLLYGIIAVLIGLILSVKPVLLVNIFPIAIGVVLIFCAVLQGQKVMALKEVGYSGWTASLIGALLTLAGGIILIAFPERSVNFLFRLTGIFMIVQALLILWQTYIDSQYLNH